MADPERRFTTRRALFDLIWSKPMTHVAAEFGTNGFHIRALCDRLKLPVPVQGHWMKAEVGKASPAPAFPAEAALDSVEHEVKRPQPRGATLPASSSAAGQAPAEKGAAGVRSEAAASIGEPDEDHKLVKKTRAAFVKAADDERVRLGGSGRFRIHVFGGSAQRVCSILNSLLQTIEARGWTIRDGKQGLEFAIEDEAIGFSIEERERAVPHIVTPEEERRKADYERRRTMALRGYGEWPGPAPHVPLNDYRPTGQLVFKLDDGIRIEGLRRTFADGKTQRLERMIGDIIISLERWSEGAKHWREQQKRWQREAEESEERRRAADRRARMDGYRMTFLRKQAARLDEIASIERVLDHWKGAGAEFAKLRELVEWARDHRERLLREVSAPAVESRLSRLRLMEEEAYICDGHID